MSRRWTLVTSPHLRWVLFLCVCVPVVFPSPPVFLPEKLQDPWRQDDANIANMADDEWEDSINGKEEEIPLTKGHDLRADEPDDPYTVVEYSSHCAWCDNDMPVNDPQFKMANIVFFNVYVPPGTCVVNQSPAWPAKYPNNEDHRWNYYTDDGIQLNFTVPVGGLQISKCCHRDKLVVRIGRRIVKKCAQFYNFFIDSGRRSNMYIRFASNHRIRWHGYTGLVCAAGRPSTTTTRSSTSTTTPASTTTTTAPEPILCDDICGYAPGIVNRISMPMDSPMVYPWVVIIDVLRDHVYVRCGGYLISRRHIITSAFCFYQETPMGIENTMVRVTAGEYDLSEPETPAAQVLYTTDIVTFPLFEATSGGGIYNTAIITMPGNGFTLNARVSPICLANDTVHADTVGTFSTLLLSGFGWTEFDYPAINMSTVTLTTCPFIFPDMDLICIYIPFTPITPCHGDAGNAIYVQWNDGRYYSVAHVNAVTTDFCPLNGFVFPCPRTSFYFNWINNVTGDRYCHNY